MSPPRVVLPPGLDELLKALRAAGLPVGTREILRLHRVFSLEPSSESPVEDPMQRLLLAVLVHSAEERLIFDPIYRGWHGRWEQWKGEGQHEVLPRPTRPSRVDGGQPRRRGRPVLWIAAVLVLMTGLAALWFYFPSMASSPSDSAPPPLDSAPPPLDSAPPPPAFTETPIPEDSFRELPGKEQETEKPPNPVATSLPFIGLGFLLTGASLVVWNTYRRRHRPKRRLKEPSLPGPKRVPYLPLPDTGPELLSAEDARTLVWGVGRHLTENLTPEIDLDRTADATARRAGLPNLRHVPEQRLREVWLWLDGLVADPALERYAEEIAASLEQNGLPVRIGTFEGYPEELEWDEGQRFRPGEVEGHRQTSLVAVMTDGKTLVQHARDNRQAGVKSLLRSLALWERLAFIDPAGNRDLAKAVGTFGIPCLTPEALPSFFGFGATLPPSRKPVDPGKLRTWKAALALAPRAVERRDAHALRRDLGLDVSPWAFRKLEEDGALGVHVDLADQQATELRWLRGADDDHEVEERTLDFWERRLAEEDRKRLMGGGLERWEDKPARLSLKMERAFLKLRRDPQGGSEDLAGLAAVDEGLAEEIEQRLRSCEDAGAKSEARIPLPWRFEELSGAVRLQLRDLGLDVGLGKLRSPGRLALALGILVGLATVFLAQGLPPSETPPKTVDKVEESQDDCPKRMGIHEATGMRFVRVCDGRFQMGSEVDDEQAAADEKPAHDVALTGFWIGETEVSNAQVRKIISGHPDDDDLPASLDWFDARNFCQQLGRSDDWEYRLPSEAQWEYAARGTTGQPYPWGDAEPTKELAVFDTTSAEPVGGLSEGAGPFGTLDQAGNVWEWVLDCYDEDLYKERVQGELETDPTIMDENRCDTWESLGVANLQSGETPVVFRVLRGGSFLLDARWLRSARRSRDGPELRSGDVGFRCVRIPRRQP